MSQSSYIVQVSPLPGKWDKLAHKGNISQIQVQKSNNSDNVVIYATGDAEFVSDMVAQNKPLIEASDGTKYYELSSSASKINITLLLKQDEQKPDNGGGSQLTGGVSDQKTKNKLAPFDGGSPSYSWETGNQFIRTYGGNDKGPTIEFQIRKAPANGEAIGHVWLPDGVTGQPHKDDDEITLIVKDNHAENDNKEEFQYKIRVPFNKDDNESLLYKEYQHHDYEEIKGVNYNFRPVAQGGCIIGLKAVWYDTKKGVKILFYVDKGEGGKDSFRPNKEEHEKHLKDKWNSDGHEKLADFFFNGNPTNIWELVFEYEDTEKDPKGKGPYKGETGVQTAFRIDAKGEGKMENISYENRPMLYGALVREIQPPEN